MATHVVFFSYARTDADATKAIASGLQQLGQNVWLDQQLSGGQPWWDTILEQIRGCDVFLFVLSESSLRSRACRAELEYAHQLDRTILPVSVHHVIDQLLPPFLAETQRVDGADLVQLARALLALPAPPQLPDPLPPPPPVPLSYLDELADSLNRDDLSLADQRNLLGALKQLVREDDEREAAVELLRRLRRHRHVNAWVAEEIDTELAKFVPPASTVANAGDTRADGVAPSSKESAEPTAQAPQGSPSEPRRTMPPTPQRLIGASPAPRPGRRRAPGPTASAPRRTRRAVMLVALLAAALAGGGIAVTASVGGSDDVSDPLANTEDTPLPEETSPDDTEVTPPDDTEVTPPEDTEEPPPDEPVDEDGGLRDACAGGDMAACDQLFFDSDFGSEDEAFGGLCGGRSEEPLDGECLATFG